VRDNFQMTNADDLSDLPIDVYRAYHRLLNSLSWIWKGEIETDEMRERVSDNIISLYSKVRYSSRKCDLKFNYKRLMLWLKCDVEEKRKTQSLATN